MTKKKKKKRSDMNSWPRLALAVLANLFSFLGLEIVAQAISLTTTLQSFFSVTVPTPSLFWVS